MNYIEILEKLKDEQYNKETLKTICEFYDEEFKPYVLSTEEKEALENLIKENKELKEETVENQDYIKYLQKKLTNAIEIKYIHQDYIPKSKVKENIEEINKILDRNLLVDKLRNYFIAKKEALQELLEGDDK